MRKEKIDITERFKTDRGEKKEVLNLVVVGKSLQTFTFEF